MEWRRREMREVNCDREETFFLLTARRLQFPQRETLHLSYRKMRVQIRASHAEKLRLFILQAL